MISHRKEFEQQGFTVYPSFKSDEGFLSTIKSCHKDAKEFASPNYRKSRGFTLDNGSFNHILFPHLISDDFKSLILSAPVQKILAELFDKTPLFVTHSKISYKFPEQDQQWLPHQDSGYKIRQCSGATLAIFLEDCTESDGPIQLFPESHKLGRIKHKRVLRPGDNNPQATVETLPDIRPLAITGKQGDILVFNVDTIHQSQRSLGSGFRSVLLFEVEPIRFVAVESNGVPALVLNGKAKLLQRSASLFFAPSLYAIARAKTLARVILKTFLWKQT